MARPLLLSDGLLSAVVRPELGAGLARLDYVTEAGPQALLRPEPPGGTTDPLSLGMQVLVPWSNRVSSGGFSFRGRRYELPLNVKAEPFPIHGNGFSERWEVVTASAAAAALRLDSVGPGPFCYRADLTYAVGSGTLGLELTLRNTGPETLPFGLGFHPWFVRSAATVLQAGASAVWLETARHLPAGPAPVPLPAEWDFTHPAPLPKGFINNGFVGWNGQALVHWPERRLQLRIEASPMLSTYILYAPSAEADFFCFEPVSHPVDAFNLPGPPEAHGLAVLAPGEAMAASLAFTVTTGE